MNNRLHLLCMQFNFVAGVQRLSTTNALSWGVHVSVLGHVQLKTLYIHQIGRTIGAFTAHTDFRVVQFVFSKNIDRWENLVTNQAFMFAAGVHHFHVIFQFMSNRMSNEIQN